MINLKRCLQGGGPKSSGLMVGLGELEASRLNLRWLHDRVSFLAVRSALSRLPA